MYELSIKSMYACCTLDQKCLVDLTNRKWFSVVYTLIDNDICHHSGQNLLWTGAQQILTTVMTNIIVNKSRDNAEPLLICFLPQYSTLRKVFTCISEREQNHDAKKEQVLPITFSQYDLFISQNGNSWLAITLCDKIDVRMTCTALSRLLLTTAN